MANGTSQKTYIAFDSTLDELREHGIISQMFAFTNGTIECVTEGAAKTIEDTTDSEVEAQDIWSLFEIMPNGDMKYQGTLKKTGMAFIPAK